jgi:hypothetical protein
MTAPKLAWLAIAYVLVMAARPVVADEAKWVRIGLEWSVQLPPPQFVDPIRVKQQMAAGCGGSSIKFGDTAVMRGWPSDITWPLEIRKLAASAALVDEADLAYSLLDQVLDRTDLDAVQRGIIENQLILTALQFNDPVEASRLLSLYGKPTTLPAPLTSDRLFWEAILNGKAASPKQWQSELLPKLDAAMGADPSSFQVRAWRVIGWLEAEGWNDMACGDAISVFSKRLLDMSDAGACPLMISHFAHASDLHFGTDVHFNSIASQAIWRQFATALLAVIAKDHQTVARLRQTLSEMSGNNVLGQTECAEQMAIEIRLLEQIE